MKYKSKYAKYKLQRDRIFDKLLIWLKCRIWATSRSINTVIDFEFFRPNLRSDIAQRRITMGAKRYDPVLLFKIMVLQRIYGLMRPQCEYQ
jgi:hypothetical protein